MNLLTLQHTTAGTVARNLTSYGSNDGALSAMYTSIASAIANENVASYMAELINDSGRVVKCERYEGVVNEA